MKVKENWWQRFSRWWAQDDRREIMMVHYYPLTNMVGCTDWASFKIWKFSGILTPELWQEIKHHCRATETPRHVPTRIYIWAGEEKKFLAYCEPIENYLYDKTLLQTGQGFHYGSGKTWEQHAHSQCTSCGQVIK